MPSVTQNLQGEERDLFARDIFSNKDGGVYWKAAHSKENQGDEETHGNSGR